MAAATLDTPLEEQLAESTHWSDDPPVRIEDEEFDRLAFELWSLGSWPDPDIGDWEEDPALVVGRASCL